MSVLGNTLKNASFIGFTKIQILTVAISSNGFQKDVDSSLLRKEFFESTFGLTIIQILIDAISANGYRRVDDW